MKRLFATAAILIGLATPVSATDLSAMSNEERDAFGVEVRAYLLQNPEVLMEAIAILEQRQADAQNNSDETLVQVNSADLFEDGYSFVGGNIDGDITMVEFLDYRCGYCKKAHEEVAQLLRDDGNIRYIVKEFPILGDQSVLASRFAISTMSQAGPEAYAKVHDNLMTYRGAISEDALKTLATALNLDVDKIMGHMDSDEVSAIISANHELGQRMQVNGTPSFIVGNQMMRGYVPLDDMKEIVAELRGG